MSKAETLTSRLQRGFVAMTFLAAYTLSAFAPFLSGSVAYAQDAQTLEPQVVQNENTPVNPPPVILKDWVCKYVGKPGVNERLKPGNEGLIWVDDSATESGWFGDAQDRSYVLLANAPHDPQPNSSQCPAPDGPDEVPIPNPGANDPCGPGNAVWDVPANTASITWDLEENGHLVAYTTEGYEFPGGKVLHDFGKAEDGNNDCPPVLVQPPAPVVQADLCGTEKDTYFIPVATGVKYYVNEQEVATGVHSSNGALVITVTAVAADGSGYTKDNSWPLPFTNVDCNSPVLLQKPGQLCVSGPDNDTLSYPPIDHVTYTPTGWVDGENTVTATAAPGYYFQGTQGLTQVHWDLTDEDIECDDGGGSGEWNSVVALEPTTVVVCGPNNDTVTLPEVDNVTYTQTGWANGQNTVTATAHERYYFETDEDMEVRTETEPVTTKSWVLTDDNTPCGEVLGETTVTPNAPTLPVGGQGAALQDTGNDMLLPMLLSTGILGLAIMTMLQNSTNRRRPSRLATFLSRGADQLQIAFAQPFSTV